MARNLIIGGLVVVALIIGSVLYLMFGNRYSWHQKMTVTVQTPNGDISGSSVSAVSWRHEKLVPGAPGGNAVNSLRGEAAIVDFGNGRYLFALIKGAATLAPHAVLDQAMLMAPFNERGAQLEQVGRKGPVPADKYPMLVTFDDITDPASVKRVDPNNLAASFGEGYALKSITLEITDEPVTSGKVESVLGWLGDYYNKRFDGNRYGTTKTDNKFANSLASGAFDTENNK